MAQPILDAMHLELATLVGDGVSSATEDGKLFTAVSRLAAINEARQRKFDMVYNEFAKNGFIGISAFIESYKEFCRESAGISLSGSKAVKPSNCRYIIAVLLTRISVSAGQYEPKRITEPAFYDFLTNADSNWESSASEYKFRDSNGYITIYGERTTGIAFAEVAGTITINYIGEPIDLTAGGTDIADPIGWRRDTIEIAAKILKSTQQEG